MPDGTICAQREAQENKMESLVHVKGFDQLAKFLDDLTPKLQKNLMRGALRAGMAVVKPDAAQRIHSVSGELAKGLKLSTGINKDGTVYAKIKAGGKHGYVASWVEYGTHAHVIYGVVAFRDGNVRKGIHHPGARPHPFMRPALDTQASAALAAAGLYLRSRLTQQGLDTAYIDVGVA